MFIAATVFQLVGLFLLFGLICYTVSLKPTIATRNILVMLFCTGLAMLGFLFEMYATTLEEAILAVKIGYLGKPFLLLATLYFVARYSKIQIPKPVFWILNTVSCAFIVIIYTNQYHHLYYTSSELVEGFGGHLWIVSQHGPLYWAYAFLIAGYLLANIVMSIIATKKAKTKRERRETLYIYALLAVGIAGYLFYLTGLTDGYDTTVVGLFIDTIIMMVLFWRYSLLDTLYLAKDKALDIYSNALIVLDTNETVLYTNKTSKELFPNIIENKKFMVAEEDRLQDGDLYYHDDKIYRFHYRDIEQDGASYGTIIEFRDVTRDVNYNQILNKEVEARTKEIRKIQRGVIYSFANVVEARDQDTGDHIKNTATYVWEIAQALKAKGKYQDILNDQTIEMYQDVAPLHDIGKIVIPDSILLKPGKLTPEEFAIMKTHTTAGAKLIEENMTGVESPEYVQLARNIALCHHERWNGTGYPNGLKGEEIPLEARIMSIADVYDALRSKRPYKDSFSVEKSIAIMKEGRESQFDPEILDVFFELIEKEELTEEKN